MSMNSDSNPYSPPETLAADDADGGPTASWPRSRMFSAILGSGIGLAVGVLWTIVFDQSTGGAGSLRRLFLVFTTGLTITGLAVGTIQRLPLFVGAVIGLLAMSAWALVVGPRDGWIIVVLFFWGVSGLVCGLLIGCLFWIVQQLVARMHYFGRRG
jgi:hypothetical protein